MKKNDCLVRASIFGFALLINTLSTVHGETLHVPAEYSTIQAAINSARPGDTVLVADGIYEGSGNVDLNFGGRAITVASENGPTACVIRGGAPGFSFETGEDRASIVQGFTISYGLRGIRCSHSSPSIVNCVIENNTARDSSSGAGIFAAYSSPLIIGCTIRANTCTMENGEGPYGAGISLWQVPDRAEIIDCVIAENRIEIGYFDMGYGAGIYFEGQVDLFNCLIVNNAISGPGRGNGAGICGATAHITNCTFKGNSCSGTGIDARGEMTNSICWGNTEPETRIVTATYSDIRGGLPGEGNLDADPLFVVGGLQPTDAFYLSQLAAGQSADSQCIQAGNGLAADVCFETGCFQGCLIEGTTRTDGVLDVGTVDMGYHYSLPGGCFPSPSPTPAPTATMPATPEPSLTPTPTLSPTPLPELTPSVTPPPTPSACAQRGVVIEFSNDYVSPGQQISCKASICNPGNPTSETPFVALLDLGIGEYWYYPSWVHWPPEFDYKVINLQRGITEEIVLPPFTWPDTGPDAGAAVKIWGALLDQTMTVLDGELGCDTFTCGK